MGTTLKPRIQEVPDAVKRVLLDDDASPWLRGALWNGLLLDPNEAAREAHRLAEALEAWARTRGQPPAKALRA